jgi:hypothetical protein
VWYLEVELRDESVIKVTPVNSEFGEALNLKTPKVSGRFVSWDEETIRLKKVGVPFRAAKNADVYYDILVEDARKINYTKTGKEFSTGKTIVASAGVGAMLFYAVLALLLAAAMGSAAGGG